MAINPPGPEEQPASSSGEQMASLLHATIQGLIAQQQQHQSNQLQQQALLLYAKLRGWGLLVQGLAIVLIIVVIAILAWNGRLSSTVSTLLGTIAGLVVGTGIGSFFASRAPGPNE